MTVAPNKTAASTRLWRVGQTSSEGSFCPTFCCRLTSVRNECLTDADERRRSPNIGQSHSDIGARRRVSRTSATTPGLIPVSRATSSTQRLRSHRLLFCIALISSQLGSLGAVAYLTRTAPIIYKAAHHPRLREQPLNYRYDNGAATHRQVAIDGEGK